MNIMVESQLELFKNNLSNHNTISKAFCQLPLYLQQQNLKWKYINNKYTWW